MIGVKIPALSRNYAACEIEGRTKSMRSIVAATPYSGVSSPGSGVTRRAFALARTRTDRALLFSAGSANVNSTGLPGSKATLEWK